MFTQDHKADFQAVLDATSPFALVRFGDGETALIDGKAHRSADAWSTSGPVWLRDELYEALSTNLDGFCVGLPPACCLTRGLKLRACVGVPMARQTFATLFLHGNLPRVNELQKHFKDALIVNDKYGEIKIPADGVTNPWELDDVVEELLKIRSRPILLSAGPCSNIIALRYWKKQSRHLRVPIIDIGSPLDMIHGYVNRHYHGTMNDHECYWHELARPEPLKTRGVHPLVRGRIRIGRAAPTDAKRIQRVSSRIKIGKP